MEDITTIFFFFFFCSPFKTGLCSSEKVSDAKLPRHLPGSSRLNICFRLGTEGHFFLFRFKCCFAVIHGFLRPTSSLKPNMSHSRETPLSSEDSTLDAQKLALSINDFDLYYKLVAGASSVLDRAGIASIFWDNILLEVLDVPTIVDVGKNALMKG